MWKLSSGRPPRYGTCNDCEETTDGARELHDNGGNVVLGRKTTEDQPTTTGGSVGRSGADSIISKQMVIHGDCVVEGRIRIEGTIKGNVKADGLELAESGTVEGDISAASEGRDGRPPFVIAGRVDGSVRSLRVEIAPAGKVLGGVEADEVQVRGRVQGGVVARKRLVLKETAVVEGDVRARVLGLEEGGQVNGTIVMGEKAATEAPTSSAGGSGTLRMKKSAEKADTSTKTGGSGADGKTDESQADGAEEEPAA